MYQRIQTEKAPCWRFSEKLHSPCAQQSDALFSRDPVLHDTGYDLAVGNLVIRLIATLEKVSTDELTGTSRGRAEVSLSRQVAMYLMHTVFSCPYHRVAAFFGRDRTTISHACRIIEDMRDCKEFDRKLEVMENLLVSARTLLELTEASADG